MTGTPPFECGPECPAPDHHGRGPRVQASSMPATATRAAGAAGAVSGARRALVLGSDLGHPGRDPQARAPMRTRVFDPR